jgi:aminopeptidase N
MLAPLLALALAAPPALPSGSAHADSLLGPGVSQALARRRASDIRDVRYELSLDLARPDSAIGRVALRFRLARPTDVIIDFRGSRLDASSRASANGAALGALHHEDGHLVVPRSTLRAGENVVSIERFATPIAASGASIIHFHDASDGSDYLYTLLVPADANQLFPCFDQPDLKARVTLTLDAPSGWNVVANGTEQGSDRHGETVRHRFRETEPLSTYLIAFAAGPWATFTSERSSRPLTLYVRRSRAKEVEADSILLANDRAATWLEGYFDSKFPFQKLDAVLAPAFPFGGMEHPGAIFYNENSFIYREPPTLPQRLGRTATIYHEVAHQWFGDLVTMRWFDDLWLKEGFATYMAAKMQHALDPSAEAWKTFYLRNKPAAYAVDLTEGTTPVWQRLSNLDQAKSNYGPIVYNKAPGVLTQLNYLVGDSAFRVGLQHYLHGHAYANATWRDLLDAVGGAAHRPLAGWGEQYILRPGMPVVEQQVRVEGERLGGVSLVQHPAQSLSGAKPWPIRTEVLLGWASRPPLRIPVTLTADTTRVPIPAGTPAPDFVFANARDYAYALVLLDDRSTAWVERNLGRVEDDFLRAMLWGAAWDLVREARLRPSRFIALAVRELPAERDEQIVSGVLGRLARATSTYLVGPEQERELPAVERMLRAGADDAARPYGIRKQFLDTYISVAATPSALAHLDSLLDAGTAAGAPLRAPTRWAIVTHLLERGARKSEARLAAETRSDTTSDGRRRAFVANAARPEARQSYFRRYFADSTLNEEWVTASLGAFNAPEAERATERYLRPALDSLPWIQRNRRIFFLGSWISSFVEGRREPEALEIVRRFLTERRDLPRDIREKVLQATDELQRTIRIRRTFGPAA